MKYCHPLLSAILFCLIGCSSVHNAVAQTEVQTDTQPVAKTPSEKPVVKNDGVTNLLLNSSMEHWHPSGLRAQGWGVWTPDPLRQSWSVHRSHDIKHDGQSAMQVNISSWANAYAGAKVNAGKTYTFSIWVYCDKPVELTLTLNLGGKDVDGPQRAAKRVKETYDLIPGQWQRVHVTDTMPPGTDSATCYLFLRGGISTWYFDQGMLNEGPLAEYVPGQHYEPITPLGREKQKGETTFTPAYWNAQDQLVDVQETAFAFDSDIMSLYRLHESGASIGAVFESPVHLRGLSLLLHEPILPPDIKVTLQIKRNDQWQDYDYKPVAVGNTTLLAFEPIDMQAFRLRFTFKDESAKDAAKDKKTNRKLLSIYNIGMAQ